MSEILLCLSNYAETSHVILVGDLRFSRRLPAWQCLEGIIRHCLVEKLVVTIGTLKQYLAVDCSLDYQSPPHPRLTRYRYCSEEIDVHKNVMAHPDSIIWLMIYVVFAACLEYLSTTTAGFYPQIE